MSELAVEDLPVTTRFRAWWTKRRYDRMKKELDNVHAEMDEVHAYAHALEARRNRLVWAMVQHLQKGAKR